MKLKTILNEILSEKIKTIVTDGDFPRYNEPSWKRYNISIFLDDVRIGSTNLVQFKKSDEWFINGFFIEDGYKNMGYGKILMENLIKFAKEKNIKIITLSVHNDNFSAIKVYEKYGFKETNTYDNVINMKLEL